ADIVATSGLYTDVDNGALRGIAINGVDDSFGEWQFSINGGVNWQPLYQFSDDFNATLLAADGAGLNRVRLPPFTNFNGTSSISFRGWDQTDFNPTGTEFVYVGNNGGDQPYSAETETASITVNAVNDAPLNFVPLTQATSEDAPVIFSSTIGNTIS